MLPHLHIFYGWNLLVLKKTGMHATDEQRDAGQTDTHADRHTYIQTERQSDIQTHMQTDRQTDRHTYGLTDRQTYTMILRYSYIITSKGKYCIAFVVRFKLTCTTCKCDAEFEFQTDGTTL